MRLVAAFGSPPIWWTSTTNSFAWPAVRPAGDCPRSMIRTTDGSDFSLRCTVASAAESAAVSGPADLAATSGTGSRLAVPKGAASMVAFSTGALAGRNLVLSLWVTLDKLGRNDAAATAAMIHSSSMDQRNRTLNRPSMRKMASTSMAASVVDKHGCQSLAPAS